MFSLHWRTDKVDFRGRINNVVLKCEVFPIFPCELFRKDYI